MDSVIDIKDLTDSRDAVNKMDGTLWSPFRSI